MALTNIAMLVIGYFVVMFLFYKLFEKFFKIFFFVITAAFILGLIYFIKGP